MWMSVSLHPVSMEEAARIWSTLMNVCVQTDSQVGETSYLFLLSPNKTKLSCSPPEAPHRVVSCPCDFSFSLTDLDLD